MTKQVATERRGLGERLQDACWTVATTVVSALMVALALYAVGEVSGVNDRIFNGTCDEFDALSPEQRRDVLNDAEARRRLDVDRDGVLCERA